MVESTENEPTHDKTNNKTCVTSKYTDQPVDPSSNAMDLVNPSLDSPEVVEDSDKTARMRRDDLSRR